MYFALNSLYIFLYHRYLFYALLLNISDEWVQILINSIQISAYKNLLHKYFHAPALSKMFVARQKSSLKSPKEVCKLQANEQRNKLFPSITFRITEKHKIVQLINPFVRSHQTRCSSGRTCKRKGFLWRFPFREWRSAYGNITNRVLAVAAQEQMRRVSINLEIRLKAGAYYRSRTTEIVFLWRTLAN